LPGRTFGEFESSDRSARGAHGSRFCARPRRFLWDQEKELWDIFHELDRDGDGKLDEAELANALKRNGGGLLFPLPPCRNPADNPRP
jgi:hypothetical protein